MKHIYSVRSIKCVVTFILLGGAILGYYYDIDGQVFHRPIEFINGVDPNNLSLDKKLYEPGDTPKFQSAFCKTRPASVITEWTLVDGHVTFYAPQASENIPVGCYPISEGKVFTEGQIEPIPRDYQPTCDAYFVGVAKVEISGGRVVTYNFRTKPFCIE